MLVVLDGFGLGDGGPDDATARAHSPFLERMRSSYPTARIETREKRSVCHLVRWATQRSGT
jgi:bisphosphoglycerate-independent phosphoglycerate mutase (AlkP superfamily)